MMMEEPRMLEFMGLRGTSGNLEYIACKHEIVLDTYESTDKQWVDLPYKEGVDSFSYLDTPLLDEQGRLNHKVSTSGNITPRSAAEKEQDVIAPPVVDTTVEKRLEAVENAILYMIREE